MRINLSIKKVTIQPQNIKNYILYVTPAKAGVYNFYQCQGGIGDFVALWLNNY